MKIHFATDYQTILPPQRPGDGGFDIAACTPVKLRPKAVTAVPTGAHVELPAGCTGLIRDRSSMAARGFFVVGGVLDAGFRGEIKVLIYNSNDQAMTIEPPERIAQMLIVPVCVPPLEVVGDLADLSPSERGANGFGSTGRV